MPSLLQIIKRAAVEAVEASNPMRMMQGTVVDSQPLKIQVEQKIVLTDDFVLSTEGLDKMNLVKGDVVVMLREQGGQEFFVLDKMKEGDAT